MLSYNCNAALSNNTPLMADAATGKNKKAERYAVQMIIFPLNAVLHDCSGLTIAMQ